MSDAHTRKNALKTLFSLYKRPMYYYALKITKDPHSAEDIVQDAFCKIIKYIDAIDYENDRAIKSYLCAVVRSCAADSFRKNKSADPVTDPTEKTVLYIDNNFPSDFDIDKEISELSFEGDIGDLITKLKEDDQIILYLRYGHDAGDEEIAAFFDLKTAAAARKRLSRAKERLRDLYMAEGRK